ncbi:hypothetical protein SI65_03022 [Aspergillus cristatus]|uniref:Peroxin 20 n=1 Tax=Aspergillus cristatus TaxID=573508 RepID=A0A1E3BP66_ASPCR|nr:hypothetical protein SI65_03022 [Aspergillus cristatus]
MSDALCGPSNALQNFQKHASVDRTLQQDRLISRQPQSQGFRSQNTNEGSLDPEFAAFESDLAGPSAPQLHHAGPFAAPGPYHPMPGHMETPNWASDFQRLQISGPSHPIHQQPGPSMASQQGWQNEFMAQQRPHQPQQQQAPGLQHHQPYGYGFQLSSAQNYSLSSAQMNTFQPQETVESQQPQANAFDESAFEAAFEQAKATMELEETNTAQTHAEIVNESAQFDSTVQPETHEEIRIGSDTIAPKEDAQGRPNDADELARTAGQLLNSVSHETNEKFQQSNFLALMRRIRDREVQIEGDEFRETAQSLHPGGKYYPQDNKQQQTPRPASRDENAHIIPNGSSEFDQAGSLNILS